MLTPTIVGTSFVILCTTFAQTILRCSEFSQHKNKPIKLLCFNYFEQCALNAFSHIKVHIDTTNSYRSPSALIYNWTLINRIRRHKWFTIFLCELKGVLWLSSLRSIIWTPVFPRGLTWWMLVFIQGIQFLLCFLALFKTNLLSVKGFWTWDNVSFNSSLCFIAISHILFAF